MIFTQDPFTISEIIYCIFSFIDPCDLFPVLLVNKSWYEIALPMMWKEIGYQYGCLPDCYRLGEVLRSRPYHPQGVQHVRKLGIMCSNYCIDKKDVSHIVQNCKNLHTIIINCELATDKTIIDILRYAGNLKHLGLLSCQLSSITWFWLSVTCRNLHSLNVTLSDICYMDIFRISAESPSLSQLILKYCDKITDAAITDIANKCPHLCHVSLKGCGEITDVSVRVLAQKCPNLHYLNLRDCVSVRYANGTMETLAARCQNLEYFNSKVDGTCFENNRNLYLASRGIQLLASGCKGLRFLILDGCTLIDDSAVCEVAKNCVKLEKIKLRYCAGISSRAVFEIAKSCPDLRYIDVSGCGNIQDDAICTLLQSCDRLQYANLSGCAVTDNIVHKARGLRKKLLICVTGCSSISPEALKMIEDKRNLYLMYYSWIRYTDNCFE